MDTKITLGPEGHEWKSEIGCIFQAIALAIIIWAFSGFPGLK